MIDTQQATRDLARLSVLKFFPADQTARTEIMLMACKMAQANADIAWLANRCLELWNEWEGPREMRAVFCSRFRPADGIEAYSQLPRFSDGIPSEKAAEPCQLGGAAVRQIAGPRETAEELTAAVSIRPVIEAMARAKDMHRIGQRPARVPSIPVVQITAENRITAADIERAKMERAK
jgi:hypothetical protein